MVQRGESNLKVGNDTRLAGVLIHSLHDSLTNSLQRVSGEEARYVQEACNSLFNAGLNLERASEVRKMRNKKPDDQRPNRRWTDPKTA